MAGDGAVASRIDELDAARGFALCGIVVVNIWQLTDMAETSAPGVLDPARRLLSVVFEGRFYPIFSFLFGVSFALFLGVAAQRSDRPRVIMVRRLVALGVIGAVHQVFQPGEVLLPYAIVGLVILLPAVSLPRWAVLLAGLVWTIGVALALGGGWGLVPGLFLLGLAAAQYDLPDRVIEWSWQLYLLFATLLPAAIAAAVWEYHTSYVDRLTSISVPVASLLGAFAYLIGLLLLLRTEFGALLMEWLAPMGRLALTNYVSATGLILAADPRLGLSGSHRYAALLALAAAIILVQAVFSYYWLRLFRYGPLEWMWRCVTWWSVVPNRIRSADHAAA